MCVSDLAIRCNISYSVCTKCTVFACFRGYRNGFNNNAIEYKSSPQPRFNKNLQLLADDITKLEIDNYDIFISFQSEEQVKRLSKYFESTNRTPSYKPIISKISEGFVDHENKRVVYTDHEIFNRYFKFKTPFFIHLDLNIYLFFIEKCLKTKAISY